MIKYRLRSPAGDVIVSLPSDGPNRVAKISYEGDANAVDWVRSFLETERGFFGHLIGSATTPLDLYAALASASARRFVPKLLEGAELVAMVPSSDDPESV